MRFIGGSGNEGSLHCRLLMNAERPGIQAHPGPLTIPWSPDWGYGTTLGLFGGWFLKSPAFTIVIFD